ncbi:MAG: hypothetical protein INQ03_17010 [Candidatus Heimdallarchaeota archaeon]|nr:hypothetical protein [Candidatus Heimdallarchaeota archaeon]
MIFKLQQCDKCYHEDTVDVQLLQGANEKQLDHGDHLRVVYFDKKGNYLGDAILLKNNILP